MSKKVKIVLGLIAGLIALQFFIVMNYVKSVPIEIQTEFHKWTIPFVGVEFHANTMIMMWLVMAILLIPAFFVGRSLTKKPTRMQSVFELLMLFFDDLAESTLGKRGRKFFPLVITIFLFLWISNMIGVLPSFWQAFGFPETSFFSWFQFAEPSRDLNVPFGLMLIVVPLIHLTMIKELGFGEYVKSYMSPLPTEGAWLLLTPFNPFFYLNVIGEFAKGVSLAFRLFGNILGGAIIIIVVSSLVKFLVLPPLLNAFFGIFVGTIQAFVFSMLSLTYIAVAIGDVLEAEKEAELKELEQLETNG